jgi:hypothetical protein
MSAESEGEKRRAIRAELLGEGTLCRNESGSPGDSASSRRCRLLGGPERSERSLLLKLSMEAADRRLPRSDEEVEGVVEDADEEDEEEEDDDDDDDEEEDDEDEDEDEDEEEEEEALLSTSTGLGRDRPRGGGEKVPSKELI